MFLKAAVTTWALLAPLLVPLRAATQAPQRASIADSSASVIIARVSTGDSLAARAVWLENIMRRVGRDQPSQKLDAIADALTDAVIAGSRSPQWTGINPEAAFAAISSAGLTGGDTRGTPYPGTLRRLIRIHQEASGNYPHAALRMLTRVAGRPEALQYLRGVAVQNDRSAAVAISTLVSELEGGPFGDRSAREQNEALAILRELFLSNTVRQPEAASNLRAVARHFGWIRQDVPPATSRAQP